MAFPIIVKPAQGKTFADLFKQIKQSAGDKLQGIRTIRKSRGGDLILEIEKEASTAAVEKVIRDSLGKDQDIRSKTSRIFYEIRDIDPTYEKDELRLDIAKVLKIEENKIEIKSIRYGFSGTKTAFISLPANIAEILGEDKRVKIGYTSCRFRRSTNIVRCFKCHGFGHMSYLCKEDHRYQELRRRCGILGHGINKCEATRRCILCVKAGLPESSVEHIA